MCGFCGDGVNDCGVFKVVDVGIFFLEVEVLVVVFFILCVFDICCVVEVIRFV